MQDIASAAHMPFSDISNIIKKADGANDINLSNKSKRVKSGKKSNDVAIELDIPANKIEDLLQEYWVLS